MARSPAAADVFNAIAEVHRRDILDLLVTGEKGGSQAKLLLQATAISGVYDFLVTTFHVWKEYLDFQFVPVVRGLTDKARIALSFLVKAGPDGKPEIRTAFTIQNGQMFLGPAKLGTLPRITWEWRR